MLLTRKEARTLIEHAIAKAEELGMDPAVAVLDGSGRLISVDQTDRAKAHRDRMATGKARAALVLGQNTHDALGMIDSQPTRYHGLLSFFAGEIYMSGGGVLLIADGETVGAIGIAGGKSGTDEQMAEAAINAWREEFGRQP